MPLKIKNKLIFGGYLAVIAIGMSIFYISEGRNTSVLPSFDKCVVIDSGHGGWDPGKVSGEAIEKDINLSIAKKLEGYLHHAGSLVEMTRTEDTALGGRKREDLKERINIINSSGNDILVSIHQNSYPHGSAKGAQVFYAAGSEESKYLGECIQKRLQELESENSRAAKSSANYYILKKSDIPAVIVECGFLSNEEEKEKLLDEEYHEKIAWCIYKGISDYFEI